MPSKKRRTTQKRPREADDVGSPEEVDVDMDVSPVPAADVPAAAAAAAAAAADEFDWRALGLDSTVCVLVKKKATHYYTTANGVTQSFATMSQAAKLINEELGITGKDLNAKGKRIQPHTSVSLGAFGGRAREAKLEVDKSLRMLEKATMPELREKLVKDLWKKHRGCKLFRLTRGGKTITMIYTVVGAEAVPWWYTEEEVQKKVEAAIAVADATAAAGAAAAAATA